MQLTSPRGNLIEKIVRDGQGRLVRATFCVYENGGRIKARLLHAVVLEESAAIENKTLLLTGLASPKNYSHLVIQSSNIVSPYFNSNLLYSLGLQPRAPTFSN